VDYILNQLLFIKEGELSVKNIILKPIAVIVAVVILISTLFGVGIITVASSTELTALNIKANAHGKDVQVALALPITVGDFAEFSFDMKTESGQTPTFWCRDNYGNATIEPVKVEDYRYTFHIKRTKENINNITRWFFNFTNMTSDVVISNMELYKTDENFENKQENNLLAGIYGENGDFDGWSLSNNHVSSWDGLTAGKILYRGGTAPQAVNYAPLTGTAVVTKPIDYFTETDTEEKTEITSLNLKVNGGTDRTHAVIALPIANGDYVEFSFDMKSEDGSVPTFLYRDNYGNKKIDPVKVDGYRYTFNFQRTKIGDTGDIVRWFFDFTNKTSDVVISNMELYKTDSNYENKEEVNLLSNVYGKKGDFEGWSLTDNYVSSWNDLVAGKILFRSADTVYTSVEERFDGSNIVTKPLDYFTYVDEKTETIALNLKVNGGTDRTHAVIALPISSGDYVEFSFDMKSENDTTPVFMYRDNYSNIKIEPIKVEGYRYTFNFQRTKIGDTGDIVRWFFDFTNMASDVVISNMELYKTDSNYENKQELNLLSNVYGKRGDFEGWSLADNYVSSWNNLVAGKILFRSADTVYTSVGERFEGSNIVTKPIDYFVYGNEEDEEDEEIISSTTAINIKAGATGKDVQAVIALPLTVGEYAEFSFDMKTEKGQTPTFWVRDNYSNQPIEPVKVEGYRYTFHITRTKENINNITRWFFNFTNMTSDVVISNMKLHKTDENFENKKKKNLLEGVYGEKGDFNGWSLSNNHVTSWDNLTAGKILYRGGTVPQNADYAPFIGTAVVTTLPDYFAVCEQPKMAQIKLKKSGGTNSVNLLLNCKKDLYYELSFDLRYEEEKGIDLIGFEKFSGNMVDIEQISIDEYKYTFRFKADYGKREENKGIPFSMIFDGRRIPSGVTANVYIANISLSEFTNDTYSQKSVFGNLVSGENGYGQNGCLIDWNGKVVSEFNKDLATTTATVGDIWLKSDFKNVSKNIFDCEIVDYNSDVFPPIKKMIHITSTAKGWGRDIQFHLDCQKDKYYELSFKLKLEDGVVPKFAVVGDKDIAITPVNVSGNKYTFRFKAMDWNIEKVGQRFKLDFDQTISEVNVSCFELYETDSNYKVKDKSINLASGDKGFGTDGSFSNWKSELGKNGVGGIILINNYTQAENNSFFNMELLEMKDGFIDKFTKSGEHMIKFISKSQSSSEAIFFFDCKKDNYYELSFYARKETGELPSFILRDSKGENTVIKPYKIDGCKYTFRFKAQSDIQKFVMRFENKLDGITVYGFVLNKSKNSNFTDVDIFENLAAGTNGYGKNGDFDDWVENYTKTSSGLGKIQLSGDGADNLKVDFTKIPKDYFNVKIHSKPQMLHFKAEENFDYERFGLRFNLPNDPDATNYVFSYRLKLTNGSIGYIQTPDPAGVLTTITASYNYGDSYYFHLKNNARNNDSFAFNFYFPNTGVEGYITDLKLYAADGEYNIISDINLASIYGEFMDWSDRGSNKVGGITTNEDSVEIVGLEEWKDGFFEFPDFIPYLDEEEDWWLKYDLTDKVDTGVVKGQLKDKSGNVMSDTTIRLESVWGDYNFDTLTDKNGMFEFSSVPVDEYSISVVYTDGNVYTFAENIVIRNKGDIVTFNLVFNEKITIEYIDSDNSIQEDQNQDSTNQNDYVQDDSVQEDFVQDDSDDFVPEDTIEEDTEDDNTDTTTKKVLKKKYYRRRLKDQGLPMIAWIGIAVGGIAIIAVAIIVVIRMKKKRKLLKS